MQNKSYNLKLVRVSLLFLLVFLLVFSCKKDDPINFTPVVLRDRTEQQVLDSTLLDNYLKTHYYNKSAFPLPPDTENYPNISDIEIVKLTDAITISEDADSLLINAVGSPKSITFADVDYKFYVLKLNQGWESDDPEVIAKPTFADSVLVKYEGRTVDDVIFDSASTPIYFDLTELVVGWSQVLPDFNVSEPGFQENTDGTVDYKNTGLGVMFLPSGLAYFEKSVSTIPAYSPLIFKFELLKTKQNDHDGDGILSHLEDLNADQVFNVLDDDTDGDGKPNFFDDDDDGDGILTIYEYDVLDAEGRPISQNYLDPSQ